VTIGWLVGAGALLIGFVAGRRAPSTRCCRCGWSWTATAGASFLVSVLIGAALLGMFLFMTFYLQQTMGYSALRSGVAYLPFSGGIIVAAGIAAQFLPRVGPRVLMSIGGVLATGGMIWLTRLDLNSSYATDILPSFVAMALGMGLLFVPLSSTALTGVGEHDAGVASAMVNTTQQVGGSLGTALLNTIFTTAAAGFLTDHGGGAREQAEAAIHGYNVAFTASAVLLAVATVLVVAFIRGGTPPTSQDEGVAEDERLVPVPAL
jgi:Na+/melibiose symporter-like transporter